MLFLPTLGQDTVPLAVPAVPAVPLKLHLLVLALFISAKTVANHIEHIYAKIDASTRAGAGLFAMQHGLLPEHEFPARASA